MFEKNQLTRIQIMQNGFKDEIVDNPMSVLARNITEHDIQELINSYTKSIQILTDHLVRGDHL